MKLIGIGLLHNFCKKHADCRKWISCWIKDVGNSHWINTHDIKSRYPSASFLAENVIVFNVRGNNYRMEVQLSLKHRIVAIKWIGTHAEYSRKRK